jgi:hypothetical protein
MRKRQKRERERERERKKERKRDKKVRERRNKINERSIKSLIVKSSNFFSPSEISIPAIDELNGRISAA